jgi:hypothetical protein
MKYTQKVLQLNLDRVNEAIEKADLISYLGLPEIENQMDHDFIDCRSTVLGYLLKMKKMILDDMKDAEK